MKIESMYDIYKQTLLRFTGSILADRNEADAMLNEIISLKKSNTLYSINVI